MIETIIALYFKEWNIILRHRSCLFFFFFKANRCLLVYCPVQLSCVQKCLRLNYFDSACTL